MSDAYVVVRVNYCAPFTCSVRDAQSLVQIMSDAKSVRYDRGIYVTSEESIHVSLEFPRSSESAEPQILTETDIRAVTPDTPR